MYWIAFALSSLVGVWKFEKEVNTRADGSVVSMPGSGYDGLLIYTADGHVSATIMPKDRRWSLESATFGDFMGSVGEGAATAYAGTYQVDEKAHTVTHLPSVSVDPGDIGKTLIRRFELRGDQLLLSGQWTYQGEQLTFTVYWRRKP
jgi:hypothetical protein